MEHRFRIYLSTLTLYEYDIIVQLNLLVIGEEQEITDETKEFQ